MKDNKKNFHFSFFTIRVKLLGIVLPSLAIGILISILIASLLFADDTRVRITENSLSLTRIISEQIQYDIQQKTSLLSNLIPKGYSSSVKDENIENNIKSLFKDNQDILYVAILDREKYSNGVISIEKSIQNKLSLDNKEISFAQIRDSISINKNFIIDRVNNQNTLVFNASFKEKVLLGIAKIIKGNLVIILIDPTRVIRIIQDNVGFFTFFVIDTEGNLIIHSDEKVIAQKANLGGSNLVKLILESVLETKSFEYQEKDKKKYLGSFRRIPEIQLAVVTSTESKIAFSAVRLILFRNLTIAIIIILSINILLYFFAKTIITHILRLVDKTQEIEKGNYDISIRPKYKDEIGFLTHSFNNMAYGLQERERVKSAFGKFVNKELVEKSLKGEIELAGEEKNIVILFTDIRSFTSISETLEPQQVVSFLNDYFTDMVSCIEKKSGLVDKYIGDAIMAHWGSIESQQEVKKASFYIENAIDSALLMRNSTFNFNIKHKEKHPTIRNGFGIHYGPAVVGQIGTETRLEFTAIGDTVNVASRLESLCSSLKADIIISESCYEHIKGKYKVVKFNNIPIKGKQDSINAFGILGRVNDLNSPKSMRELQDMIENQ